MVDDIKTGRLTKLIYLKLYHKYNILTLDLGNLKLMKIY